MQILSRVPDGDFFDRELEMSRLYGLARRGRKAGPADSGLTELETRSTRTRANALLLGAPRTGKTELLRRTFDRLFIEQSECMPMYLGLRSYGFEPERFAREYLSQFLSQFIAFRRQDARLIALADEPLDTIAQNAPPDDYLWVRNILDSFSRAAAAGDLRLLLRCALSAPSVASARASLAPFVMIDNFHLLADSSRDENRGQIGLQELRSEFIRALSTHEAVSLTAKENLTPVYVLCGLRRTLTEMLPPDESLFDALELIRVEPMAEEPLEQMIRATAARLEVDLSDSTTELMIQQLGGDLFYTRMLLDAAATDSSRMRSFMEFERLYTDEVLQGRIGHYLDAVLRDVAPDTRSRRAAVEALILAIESGAPVPVEAVTERVTAFMADADTLLGRMHARELLEISYGFVSAPSDPVLCDYVRAKYRTEIAGVRRPVAGEELLGEKLKHSYRLMMTRYNRSVEQQLIDLLSRFDFQAVPSSLLDVAVFEKEFRGLSRAQARQKLEIEEERLRLPQIVLVNDLGNCEIQSSGCRLYAAGGFDGGIYSDSSEALWMVALVNAKEPLELEAVQQIEQRWRAAARNAIFGSPTNARRWLITKEGFSEAAIRHLQATGVYQSTYAQLDLLYDTVVKLASRFDESRSSNEVELIIPIEEEAELIAVRTVEQIARAADFDKESINQIKTALIEACINAAEHSDSPDRKIYHRFAVIDDRLVIRISNKGKVFDGVTPAPAGSNGEPLKGTRGRGLKIIRGLMDDVHFEQNDDGTTLVMTKLLKRQEKQ